MQETNGDLNGVTDPLAEIIRATGQRPMPSEGHYEQVFAATHAVWQRRIAARRRRRWYALAAALALFAMGGTLWQTLRIATPEVAVIELAQGRIEQYLPDDNRWAGIDGSGVAEETLIRTGADGFLALRLADGGSLRLSSATELLLGDATFELRSGRLYFDSAGRDSNMPIAITTPLGTVRDIGTQFEILTTQMSLRVRVRSGSVAVLDSPAAQTLTSQSAEQIELSNTGAVSRRSFAPDDPQWRWAEALAVPPGFETPSVLAYVSWIAAETGRRLEFVSENVRLQAEFARFLGDPEGLMPTELLDTITATTDFSYELTDDGRILISRDNQL